MPPWVSSILNLSIFVTYHVIIVALLVAWLTRRGIDQRSLLYMIIYLVSVTTLALARRLLTAASMDDSPRYAFVIISIVVAVQLLRKQLPGVSELWRWLKNGIWRRT